MSQYQDAQYAVDEVSRAFSVKSKCNMTDELTPGLASLYRMGDRSLLSETRVRRLDRMDWKRSRVISWLLVRWPTLSRQVWDLEVWTRS